MRGTYRLYLSSSANAQADIDQETISVSRSEQPKRVKSRGICHVYVCICKLSKEEYQPAYANRNLYFSLWCVFNTIKNFTAMYSTLNKWWQQNLTIPFLCCFRQIVCDCGWKFKSLSAYSTFIRISNLKRWILICI